MHQRRVQALLVQLVAEAHRARSNERTLRTVLDSESVQGMIEAFVGDDPVRQRAMMNFFVRPVVTRAYEEPLRLPSTVEQQR